MVDDGLNLVYQGRDNTGEAVIYPHSRVNNTDYVIKSLDDRKRKEDLERSKTARADLLMAAKDTDLSKAWYVDTPELMRDVNKLKEIGALANNPQAAQELRMNAQVMYRQKKMELQDRIAASTQQKQELSTKANFIATHYDQFTDETKDQVDNWIGGGISGRKPLQLKLKPDFNYVKLIKQSVNPTGLTDINASETVAADGYTKNKVYTKQYSPEKAHQQFRNILSDTSQGQEFEKNLRAQFESIDGIDEMKVKNPSEYSKQWSQWLDNHADQIFKPMVQEAIKTGIGSAPRPPKDKIPTQKTKKELEDDGILHEQKSPPTAVGRDAEGKEVERKGGDNDTAMTVPYSPKLKSGIVNDSEIVIDGAKLKKGEEFDFIPGTIFKNAKTVTGKGIATVEVPDPQNPDKTVKKKVEFTARVPLSRMKNVFEKNGVQWKWAYEGSAPEKTKDNPAGVKYQLPEGKSRRGRKGDKWYVWSEETGKYVAE